MEEAQLFDGSLTIFLIVSMNRDHNKKYVFVFSLRIFLSTLIITCSARI